MNKKVKLIDLGLCDYKRTWDYQEELFSGIVAAKMRNRTEGTDTPTPGYLILVEHPHVYTLGRQGKEEHLLTDRKKLEDSGVSFYRIDRGGDIT